MHSMTQKNTLVVGGIDAHADTHHAAALDERGTLLASKSFPTTTEGYRQLLDWLGSYGEIDVVAVESTGSYAAALVRYLRDHDITIVEVNQSHAHTRRRVGKSDPIDAEMAARLFQAGKAKAVPKRTDGVVESIRLLRVARQSAVKSRSAALMQIRDLIITAPQELRDRLSCRKTLRGKVTVCARFRPSGRELRSPSQAAKFALRSTAQRIEALDQEITMLDRELEQLVATAAPRTVQLLGISTGHAGQLLVTAGQNIDRLRCESSFRDALRRQPDPRVVRQDHSPPPQPRRRPPSQPRASSRRCLPAALLRAHPRLRQAPNHGREDPARDHALPQALHRARSLQLPPRRPRRHPATPARRDNHPLR
jgi:transposase